MASYTQVSDMTFAVSVSNQKGGTGKTTIAVNTAGALADAGHRPLLIDLDPQGYATEATGLGAEYDADGVTLHEVLLDLDQQEHVTDLIGTGNEYDVIPANTKMSAESTETQLKTSTGGEQRLQRALEHLDTEYDFIVIDCPPGLGALTDNALLASGNVLIPAEAKETSKRALDLLSDQMESIQDFFGTPVRPVGLVANEVRPDGVSDEMLEWFEDVFGDSVPIFELRKRVALQRAGRAGVSIMTHDETCDMESVFQDIAEHLKGLANE